jgi:hypothetical protein
MPSDHVTRVVSWGPQLLLAKVERSSDGLCMKLHSESTSNIRTKFLFERLALFAGKRSFAYFYRRSIAWVTNTIARRGIKIRLEDFSL